MRITNMSKFIDGQHVWRIVRTNEKLSVGVTIESGTIETIQESTFYCVRTYRGDFVTALPGDLFANRKDALNEAIRKLQEQLFND